VGVITNLEAQKKNKERANVYVDGEFFCGLSLIDVVKQRLSVGLELTELEMTSIQAMGDENRFFTRALEYLLSSPKTKLQIKQYLYKKQVEPQVINKIIERLEGLGYIDDANFAKNFIEAKQTKIGKRVIGQKLMQRGVARDVISENVADINKESQEEVAYNLAIKYMRNKEFNQKELAKLCRYLFGKGFDYDVVSKTAHLVRSNK